MPLLFGQDGLRRRRSVAKRRMRPLRVVFHTPSLRQNLCLFDLWAQHILKRYRHAVRYFGLFAPRAVNQMFDQIFAAIGHKRRPRPTPPRWADSRKQLSGRDPLLDSTGQRMRWVRRLAPPIAQ
jgi:hypothetical protein